MSEIHVLLKNFQFELHSTEYNIVTYLTTWDEIELCTGVSNVPD